MKKLLTTTFFFLMLNIQAQFTQKGTDIDGLVFGDRFGESVASNSDGSIIAIGAPYHDYEYVSGSFINDSGSVRVFQYNSSSQAWEQLGNTIEGGNNLGDFSGLSVSLNDDGYRLAVGVPNSGDVSYGRVKIYHYNSTTENWDIIGAVAGDTSVGGRFGSSVSLSSNGLAFVAGAPYGDYARVYQYNPLLSQWNQVGSSIVGDSYTFFGKSVDINADATRVIIGAPDSNAYKGKVMVYDWDEATNTWTLVVNTILGQIADEKIGYSVSINAAGNIIAASAPYYDDGIYNSRGRVKIFYRPTMNSNWIQKGNDLTPNGSQSYLFLGYDISLDASGNKIAAGMYGNNNSTGRVKIYEYQNTDWNFLSNLDGENEMDYAGYSVDLSDDGHTVIFGAPENNNKGSARIFIDGTLSIEDTLDAQNIILYPNPSNGKINIDLGKSFDQVTVSITTLQGKEVYQYDFHQTNQINFDFLLQPGLFLVNISTDNQLKTIKMFVE